MRREALEVDPYFLRAAPLVDTAQPADKQVYFEETGHNLRLRFLEYWQKNSGLERFGYTISEVHDLYCYDFRLAYQLSQNRPWHEVGYPKGTQRHIEVSPGPVIPATILKL